MPYHTVADLLARIEAPIRSLEPGDMRDGRGEDEQISAAELGEAIGVFARLAARLR